MSELRIDAELHRLATELGCHADEVAFLATLDVAALRQLRTTLERGIVDHVDAAQLTAIVEASSAHGLEAELQDILDRLPEPHQQQVTAAVPAALRERLGARPTG